MDYITEKYVLFASAQLKHFKKKGQTTYNFVCPFCNSTDKRKIKGYLFDKNNDVWFKCFLCEAPIGNFSNFLKKLDYSLYCEYKQESMFGSYKKEDELHVDFTPILGYDKYKLSSLSSVEDLSFFDAVKTYVVGRQIPEKFYKYLYSVDKFKAFTNSLIKDKFDEKSLKMDECRLLIPFFDENKEFFAFSGRSIDKFSKLRYINITLDESKPKIYGLDRFEKDKLGYVVEGPLDSLFLDNCISTAGGMLTSCLSGFDKDNLVICYDNEPRSIYTKKKIKSAIEHDYSVCIWPEGMQFKDINQMIIAGLKKEEIEQTINDNTFKGLEAHMRLGFWGK